MSDPDLLPRGQYRNDQYTSVGVGGSTYGDGNTNNVWLEGDIYSSTPASSTNMSIEVQPTGTAFTNTASASNTARILKESTLPIHRRGANLAYDTKNKRFILSCGYDGSTRYNDAWSLTADSAYASWHPISPSGTAPTAKNLAASTFIRGTTSGSVDKAYMVIWGGTTSSASLNEMQLLDVTTLGSEAWSTINQTNTPSIRCYLTHHMVAKQTSTSTFDIYLFGGYNSSTYYNDLYKCTLNLDSPTAVTWTTLKANGAVGNPTVRQGTCMIYDSANDRLIITCGYSGSVYLNDTWQYSISGDAFTQLSPTGTAPTIRNMANIGYDSTNQRAILIGGWQGSIATSFNDVQQLSLTSGAEAWTQIRASSSTNQGVAAFSNGAAAVDSSRNILVVATEYCYDGTNKYVYAFDMRNTSTTTALVYGLTIIDYWRGRDAPANVYNSSTGEYLIFNGYSDMDDDATSARGEHVSEIWAYNRTSNKWRFALKGPFGMPANEGGLVIYDSANDRIIYFGGLTGSALRTSDVWQFKADTHGMYHATKLSPTGTAPTPRWFACGCYDVTNQRMVLWGGQSTSAVLNDTWALSLTEGSEAWTSLSPTGTAPTAAWQACFAFDSANKRLYVHGGATNTGGTTFTSQLFYLDISTTNCAWTDTAVTGGLAVRGATLGYDSTNQRLVCFGGYDGSVVNNTVRYTSTSAFTSWTTQATSNTPSARRSAGYMVIGDYFVITCGRPASGTWFNDTQELNFKDDPASWSWTSKAPYIYIMMAVPISSLTLRASYHWQAWATTGASVSDKVAFGHVVDFVLSNGTSGGYVKTYSAGWNAKPVKVWNGSSWVTKPAKVYNGTAWIETNY